jgi:hypothetical protein
MALTGGRIFNRTFNLMPEVTFLRRWFFQPSPRTGDRRSRNTVWIASAGERGYLVETTIDRRSRCTIKPEVDGAQTSTPVSCGRGGGTNGKSPESPALAGREQLLVLCRWKGGKSARMSLVAKLDPRVPAEGKVVPKLLHLAAVTQHRPAVIFFV